MKNKIDTLNVIITGDTEASTYNKMPLKIEDMVYGKIDDKYYGINLIMDICNEFKVNATFFVDEYKYFGEETIKQELV